MVVKLKPYYTGGFHLADGTCRHRGVARFDNGLPVPEQTISMVFGSGGRRAGMIPLDDRHVYW